LLVLGAALLWGGSASIAKHLFSAHQYDTITISQMRVSLSFVLYALYFLVTDRSVFRIRRPDLKYFALLGILGLALSNFSYYFTIQKSTIATAVLTQYTSPVLVMLYTVLISKEEAFTRIKVLALMLAMAGCFLAVSGGNVSAIQLHGWAIVSSIGSALGFSTMIVGSKRMLQRYSVWTLLTYALGFATLVWLVINPPWQVLAQGYGWRDWGVFWFFGVATVLIPHTLYVSSLKTLEASRVGIASTMEPVIAIVVAFFALGEALNGIQIAGAAAVVAAVLLLQVSPALLREKVKVDGE
jgi:drug/metabolite transporter (DMT)-like permease